MNPVDLDYASAGYLRSPDGRHLRAIRGLDIIARDLRAAGATVEWGPWTMRDAGRCCCSGRRIVLAPWLWRCWPWFLRLCVAHELGHIVMGPYEQYVDEWEQRVYGELVAVPEEWLA